MIFTERMSTSLFCPHDLPKGLRPYAAQQIQAISGTSIYSLQPQTTGCSPGHASTSLRPSAQRPSAARPYSDIEHPSSAAIAPRINAQTRHSLPRVECEARGCPTSSTTVTKYRARRESKGDICELISLGKRDGGKCRLGSGNERQVRKPSSARAAYKVGRAKRCWECICEFCRNWIMVRKRVAI
jgi:hypothetical protein